MLFHLEYVHFEESSYEVPLKQTLLNYEPKSSRNLKVDAVPTKALAQSCLKRKSTDNLRLDRCEKRRRRKEIHDIIANSSCTLQATSKTYSDERVSEDSALDLNNETLVYRSSTRVCFRICVSIRRPEFECSGPQLEGPEFECSGPQLEGPEFEYSELSLKDGNLLNPYVVGIKTECKDHSCNLTSDIKVEETAVPTNFSTINCKAEEWNVSHLEVMDRTDIKTEIKVEDSPVPIGLPMVKTEIDKDVFELDRFQQEQKVEVSSEEDEVFSESIVYNVEKSMSQEQAGIDHEDKLSQCGSNIPDCSNINDISRKSIQCKICNEVFVTPQSLKLHFHIHAIKKSFKCDVSGKCFLKLSDIKRRALLHNGGMPLNCDVCGKTFRRSWNMKRHALVHTREKPFKCEVCGKCFSESALLNTHVRIHSGEFPLKCEVCGKSFLYLGHLKEHARIHTGERPFKCEVCGKCFTAAATLSGHLRIHTGERPFKCEMCGKCFSELSVLNRHARIHTGERPFQCSVCGKCFSQLEHLKKHARVHTGERPFKCEHAKDHKTSPSHQGWVADHVCSNNYKGCSPDMETVRDGRFILRSVQDRGLCYTEYLGVGDLKNLRTVTELDPYDA
ncbi:hypothetical protein ANN_27701 [Periplaneta americana]|uniref:C2H2-type domain-containing protein n=1 Tax=Periplaneta americana TaxID=6978 RepID=A0ABQ8RV08_PERAM|nr:hypothetical protein ANN_27701 [Periplaneta americana]